MILLAKRFKVLESSGPHLLYEHSDDKVVVFKRAGLVFVFNFHPASSFTDYRFDASPGKYQMIFNSDAPEYGGHSRLISDQFHLTLHDSSDQQNRNMLSLYIPNRTALVLQKSE
jgi:1,4-alpha-glucan branching enzyme